MQYKFKLNLQQMSMLSIAKSMWKQEDIKDKIRLFFQNDYSFNKRQNNWKWGTLTTEVISQFDLLYKEKYLPPGFRNKLESTYIVRLIGFKIFNWTKYITKELKYNIAYAEQICWTADSSIDKLAIFNSWVNNVERLDVNTLYLFACRYCLEESIKDLWQQIQKQGAEQNKIEAFSAQNIHIDYQDPLIGYWICRMNKNMTMLTKYEHYDKNQSIVENMFKFSVSNGYELATKYFFNQLTEEEKQRNLQKYAQVVVEKSYFFKAREEYIDVFIFLISEMREEEVTDLKSTINKESIRIFQNFISLNRYDLIEKFTNLGFQTAEELITLKETIYQDVGIDACYYYAITNKYESARKFLNWCGKSGKDLIYQNEQWCQYEFRRFWGANADNIAIAKEWLEKFLYLYLDSQEEINIFKKEILGQKLAKKICSTFIDNNNFAIIEDFLDWCLLSAEEIKQFKTMLLTSDIISKQLIKLVSYDQVDQVPNFIDWCFEQENEQQEFFKEFMLSDDGICVCAALINESDYTLDSCKAVASREDKLKKFSTIMEICLRSSEVRAQFKHQFKSDVEKGDYLCVDDEDYIMFMDLLDNWHPSDALIEISSLGSTDDISLL